MLRLAWEPKDSWMKQAPPGLAGGAVLMRHCGELPGSAAATAAGARDLDSVDPGVAGRET